MACTASVRELQQTIWSDRRNISVYQDALQCEDIVMEFFVTVSADSQGLALVFMACSSPVILLISAWRLVI
jgi:hypothetical protein